MREHIVQWTLCIGAGVAIISGVTALALTNRRTSSPPSLSMEPGPPRGTVVRLNEEKTLGTDLAPIVVIEYSDFECRFCREFARNTFGPIKEAYIDKQSVQWVFRYSPMGGARALGFRAAESAECADRQRAFWPMHRQLFENHGRFGAQDLIKHADAIGLDRKAFAACMRGEAASRIAEDMKQAHAHRIELTPSFVLARRHSDGAITVASTVVGARHSEVFTTLFDRMLRANQP